eukprot:5897041-Amphidinium_carterae.1
MPEGSPEREVLHWRTYLWSRDNALLSPNVRTMQHSQGPVHCIQHWWEKRIGEPIHLLAQNRISWKDAVTRVSSEA